MRPPPPPALLVGLLLACFAIEAPAVDLLGIPGCQGRKRSAVTRCRRKPAGAGENKPQAVANLLPESVPRSSGITTPPYAA